jgi:hypothetical protein
MAVEEHDEVAGRRRAGQEIAARRGKVLGKTMASDEKKTKTDPAPKKAEGQLKDKSAPGADLPKAEGPSKAEGGEKAVDSSSGHSRGEGQKPASKAYKDNWNAIFAKKKKR